MTTETRRRITLFSRDLMVESLKSTTKGKWRLNHDSLIARESEDILLANFFNWRDGRFAAYLHNVMPELLLAYNTLLEIAEIVGLEPEGKAGRFNIDEILGKIKNIKEKV